VIPLTEIRASRDQMRCCRMLHTRASSRTTIWAVTGWPCVGHPAFASLDRDPPSDDAEAALPVQGVRPQGRDRPGWGGANVGFLLGSLKPLTGRLRPIVKLIDLMSRVDRPRRARVAPTPCGVDDRQSNAAAYGSACWHGILRDRRISGELASCCQIGGTSNSVPGGVL
jgi:hypothetical protein